VVGSGTRAHRRSGRGWLGTILIVLLAACSAASNRGLGSPPTGSSLAPPSIATATDGPSGIEGVAVADPQCPIVEPGAACPPAPVSREVAVVAEDGRELTRFRSADDGSFRVSLPPGAYTLREVVAGGQPPSLKPVSVTVPPGDYVHVVLLFDTGIR
jgi:hypothetical protein